MTNPLPRSESPLGWGTLLVDPPWPTSKHKRGWMKNMSNRSYSTMSIRDITAMGNEVDEIAARDAVLLMWATWGNVANAIDIIRAWGFEYATGMPWLKVVRNDVDISLSMISASYLIEPGGRVLRKFAEKVATRTIAAPIYGPGVWFQHCTELLLIGRRGKPFGKMGNPRPARKGIIIHPRLRPSEKPREVHEWAESKQANFPRPFIELFAREKRAGWTVWGNEV